MIIHGILPISHCNFSKIVYFFGPTLRNEALVCKSAFSDHFHKTLLQQNLSIEVVGENRENSHGKVTKDFFAKSVGTLC